MKRLYRLVPVSQFRYIVVRLFVSVENHEPAVYDGVIGTCTRPLPYRQAKDALHKLRDGFKLPEETRPTFKRTGVHTF